MNRILILSLALWLAWAVQAHASEHDIGLRYGAGLSTIFFTPAQGEGSVFVPLSAGVVYRHFAINYQQLDERPTIMVGGQRFPKWSVGLQLEFNLAQRGYTFEMRDSNMLEPLEKTVNSMVVELPAIMQIRYAPHPNIRVYANGILYGAYYMRNQMSFTHNDVRYSTRFRYEKFGGLDFGVGGGLGFGFVSGRSEVILDGRFTTGLLGLYKQTIDRYESLPMQVLVSLSYMYQLGR